MHDDPIVKIQKNPRAITRFVRISPRKARYAADLIRGKSVEEARLQLLYCKLRGGRLLQKTLDSAIANAQERREWRPENMIVSKIMINGGPILRRAKARSKGSSVPVNKRTSHFVIEIATRDQQGAN